MTRRNSSGVMFFNKKIMQEMFGNELSLAAVGGD